MSDFHDSYSKVSMRQKRSHERLDIVSVTVILAKRWEYPKLSGGKDAFMTYMTFIVVLDSYQY